MKKTLKISVLVILTFLLVFCMTVDVSATLDPTKLNQIGNPTGITKLTEMSGKIISVINAIAVVVAVGMALIIGIKYITSSPDQKASLKDRALPYVIGIILVVGAANILRFIEKMSGWIS